MCVCACILRETPVDPWLNHMKCERTAGPFALRARAELLAQPWLGSSSSRSVQSPPSGPCLLPVLSNLYLPQTDKGPADGRPPGLGHEIGKRAWRGPGPASCLRGRPPGLPCSRKGSASGDLGSCNQGLSLRPQSWTLPRRHLLSSPGAPRGWHRRMWLMEVPLSAAALVA